MRRISDSAPVRRSRPSWRARVLFASLFAIASVSGVHVAAASAPMPLADGASAPDTLPDSSGMAPDDTLTEPDTLAQPIDSLTPIDSLPPDSITPSTYTPPVVGGPDADPLHLDSSARGTDLKALLLDACDNAAKLLSYTQVAMNVSNQVTGIVGKMPGTRVRGLPQSDLGAQAAARALSKAARYTREVEQSAVVANVHIMCNAAQAARFAGDQYDFWKNVVNAGIRLTLPDLAGVVAAVGDGRVEDAGREAVRVARIRRLFERPPVAPGELLDPTAAGVDSTVNVTSLQVERAQRTADSSARVLAALARELQGLPVRNGSGWECAAWFNDSTKVMTPATPTTDSVSVCPSGPASPARARQIAAAATAINALNQSEQVRLDARRAELDVIGVGRAEAARQQANRALWYRSAPGAP